MDKFARRKSLVNDYGTNFILLAGPSGFKKICLPEWDEWRSDRQLSARYVPALPEPGFVECSHV